jgi:uncharacterized protein
VDPDVFVVPVQERWLLHAPRLRLTAVVNAAAVVALRAGRHVAGLSDALAAPPAAAPRAHDGPAQPDFIGLIPTRGCNLACCYCGFGATQAQGEPLSFDLAVAAIDWMGDEVARRGRETLEVHFFGGEPMMAPRVVEVAVHRARAVAAARGLETRLEIATNGCFDEAGAELLADYFDTVVVSLDGPPDVHDRQRPLRRGLGSYEQVARSVERLARSSVELCLRVCVTAATVGSLESIARGLCDAFHPHTLDFEALQPTAESEAAGLRPADPWTFAVMWERARRLAADKGVTAIYAGAAEGLRHTFCPVGRDTLIVSPDGRVSACYLQREDWQRRGLDLDLGRVEVGRGVVVDGVQLAAVRDLTRGLSRCERCLARWSCAGGCHVNHVYPGCSAEYDDFCIQTRLLTAVQLLSTLDAGPEIEALLADRAALERLALHASDRLWEGGAA